MGISQQIGSSSQIKPGVCTSTTRPASPYTGQVIFETDTNRMLVWNTTAWVIPNTTAQTTAPGSWTSFTPTFKFGGAAAAATSTYGFYTIINKLLILQAGFVSSGSQTAGSFEFTLPDSLEISEGRTYQRIGQIYAYDGSPATQYSGIPYVNANDGRTIFAFGQSASGTGMSNTAPFTWAVNDELDLFITARIL